MALACAAVSGALWCVALFYGGFTRRAQRIYQDALAESNSAAGGAAPRRAPPRVPFASPWLLCFPLCLCSACSCHVRARSMCLLRAVCAVCLRILLLARHSAELVEAHQENTSMPASSCTCLRTPSTAAPPLPRAEESFTLSRVIRAFGTEGPAAARYAATLRVLRHISIRQVRCAVHHCC